MVVPKLDFFFVVPDLIGLALFSGTKGFRK